MQHVEIDIEAIRAETPAVQKYIHFNNAGCSLMPTSVFKAVAQYLESEQSRGGYETALAYHSDLEGFYQSAANLVNCHKNEIAFAESATKAWQYFFYGLDFQAGDNLITTRVDYGSSMVAYIQAAQKTGVEIRFIDVDELGDIKLDHLQNLIDQCTKLISICHIPTGSGIINNAQAVGEIAQKAGILYLLDACQSAGQMALDVNKLKCTALSTTGRKYLRGPRGTGFLYVCKDYLNRSEPAILEQTGVNLLDDKQYQVINSARRYENTEHHFAGKLGLSLAMQYAHNLGYENIQRRIFELAQNCREKLSQLQGVEVWDLGAKKCGIVTFTLASHSAVAVRERLWQKNINTWVSTGPGSLIDFQNRGLDAVVRASLHYFNTHAEIDHLVEAVSAL